MKHLLSLIITLAGVLALCSCAGSKDAAAATALHKEAVQALEGLNFEIEAYEFHIPDGQNTRVIPSSASGIKLRGTDCTVRYEQKLFPRHPAEHLNLHDSRSSFALKKKLRGGNRRYELKIDGGKDYLLRTYTITLYKGSNDCLVQEYNGRGLYRLGFRGRVTVAR